MKDGGKVCCIAILVGGDDVAAARAALCEDQTGGIAQSVLRKPDCRDAGVNFYRLPVVGAVIGEGPIVQFLESVRSGSDLGFNSEIRALFNDIGIPETRCGIYLSALKAGHVLIIMQGSENELRTACNVLEGISLEKPVLCFS